MSAELSKSAYYVDYHRRKCLAKAQAIAKKKSDRKAVGKKKHAKKVEDCNSPKSIEPPNVNSSYVSPVSSPKSPKSNSATAMSPKLDEGAASSRVSFVTPRESGESDRRDSFFGASIPDILKSPGYSLLAVLGLSSSKAARPESVPSEPEAVESSPEKDVQNIRDDVQTQPCETPNKSKAKEEQSESIQPVRRSTRVFLKDSSITVPVSPPSNKPDSDLPRRSGRLARRT